MSPTSTCSDEGAVPGLLINIDVPDVEQGMAFYTAALGLTVGRKLDSGFVELLGAPVPIYLLQNDAGTSIGPAGPVAE